MQIHIVTLFPEMVEQVTNFGVVGRAIKQGRAALRCWNPRDFTQDRHRTVDDRPFGGGPGMVMKTAPTQAAIVEARQAAPEGTRVVYLSPQGEPLHQGLVEKLAEAPGLVLLCGRYEGVDERLIETEVDMEVSIGDYVLSGGELPAMVLVDAVLRLQPGVLGASESAAEDSFSEGLLDCPHYTRPEQSELGDVPGVLMSGDHAAIRKWRLQQALGRTWLRRPELLEDMALSETDEALLKDMIKDYLQDLSVESQDSDEKEKRGSEL